MSRDQNAQGPNCLGTKMSRDRNGQEFLGTNISRDRNVSVPKRRDQNVVYPLLSNVFLKKKKNSYYRVLELEIELSYIDILIIL